MNYTLEDFELPKQPVIKDTKQELYEMLKAIKVERRGKQCVVSYTIATDKVMSWFPIPF